MKKNAQFKDHFSTQAEDYSIYRPEYPADIYSWLASICNSHQLAWDCATGNGQVAVALTNHFGYIIGTDASESQIYHATTYPRVEYEVALAHKSPLDDQSVDLITVAQALHWFEFDSFFKEVERVAKPNSVLAVWCYELHQISPAVDASSVNIGQQSVATSNKPTAASNFLLNPLNRLSAPWKNNGHLSI